MAEHLKKVVVLLVEPVADNFSDVRAVLAEVIPASPPQASASRTAIQLSDS